MKRNKRLYTAIFCTLALSLTLSSCNDFLTENPLDGKTAEQFWQTKADAESGINALYLGGAPNLHDKDIAGGWTPKATMWGGIVSGLYVDKRKDRTFTSASEGCNFNIESFNDIAKSYWTELYVGISRANFALANIPNMTHVLDNATIENYVAQGKFFRAYNYFWLVKEFGGVPYITKPYTSTEGMYKERVSAEEVYKGIEQDLLDIVQGEALPNVPFYRNKGSVTKSMAQTLLAQVYLQWAGAPVNGGSDYYAKAAQVAIQIINSGQHVLEQANGSSDNLESAFNIIKTTKSSAEIIYAKEYDQTNYSIGNTYACRSIGTDAFQWKDTNDGVIFRPGGDVLYNAYLPSNVILDSYDVSDIRGKEKQFFFREYKDATGLEHRLNDCGNWAWFDEESLTSGRNGDYNMPIFRYAEVLLIAAEGLARTGSENDAKTYLNQVRKRAGVADETATGNQLIQAILTERIHELPLEFKIWDDIRRTRLYPEAAAEPGKLVWTNLTSAKIQNKPEGSFRVGAIPEYALLWPIPLSEMQANPALQGNQNPGWN